MSLCLILRDEKKTRVIDYRGHPSDKLYLSPLEVASKNPESITQFETLLEENQIWPLYHEWADERNMDTLMLDLGSFEGLTEYVRRQRSSTFVEYTNRKTTNKILEHNDSIYIIEIDMRNKTISYDVNRPNVPDEIEGWVMKQL